jgi:hypothetical protein
MCVLILLYMSVLILLHMCVLILLYMFVVILLYVCPHTTACVPSYYCMCVLILLHICVLIPLYVCPHTRTERRRIGLMSVNSVAMTVNSVTTRDAPADVSDFTCSRKSLNGALIEPHRALIECE